MAKGASSSRRFYALAASGLAVEALAACLAYKWAARVLPCRFGPARDLLGPSSVCPVPVVLVGHDSFVPAVLLGALVLVSVIMFGERFARIVLATHRARRSVHRCRLPVPASLKALAEGSGVLRSLVLVKERAPTAYCVGLLRPQVVISSGLLEDLGKPSLRAVLAHEASHRRRRDPLRAALARSVAQGLFYVPTLRDLADATLAENEISADANAAGLTGRASLAAALLAMLRSPVPRGSAAMVKGDILKLRLDALETAKRPAFRPKWLRLVTSALLVGGLLAAGAWLPRYSPSRVLRSPSHLVRAAVWWPRPDQH
jgi:beta-lactamase regulating signal transducer with metallopeptidase domain